MMRLFCSVQGLPDLERREDWEGARVLLLNQWNDDRNNVAKLCRLLSECWYVLAEWDAGLQTDKLHYDTFRTTLIEVTTYGLKYAGTNFTFLLMAGYMISLFPYLFYEQGPNDEYLAWEQKGKVMLHDAVQREPDNLIARTLLLGVGACHDEYMELKRLLQPLLKDYFTDETEIERYFISILSF